MFFFVPIVSSSSLNIWPTKGHHRNDDNPQSEGVAQWVCGDDKGIPDSRCEKKLRCQYSQQSAEGDSSGAKDKSETNGEGHDSPQAHDEARWCKTPVLEGRNKPDEEPGYKDPDIARNPGHCGRHLCVQAHHPAVWVFSTPLLDIGQTLAQGDRELTGGLIF